jgi:hypothetical protein
MIVPLYNGTLATSLRTIPQLKSKPRTWGLACSVPGQASGWLVVPNWYRTQGWGRRGTLCSSGEGAAPCFATTVKLPLRVAVKRPSFIRDRTPPDAPPLRWLSGSSGDPSKISLMPTSGPEQDKVMSKFDALVWREGTSDRGRTEPNGRGDTVAQDDDLPIAWRAATGGKFQSPAYACRARDFRARARGRYPGQNRIPNGPGGRSWRTGCHENKRATVGSAVK